MFTVHQSPKYRYFRENEGPLIQRNLRNC